MLEKLAVDFHKTIGATYKVAVFTRGLYLSLAVTYNERHLTRRGKNNFDSSTALRSLIGDDNIHVTKTYRDNCRNYERSELRKLKTF
ncbi:hypothetical protein GJ496_006377 [Pomphorhynchus laevis]|nr:hypothetical protein GJ496_006377 [Pomphorhynchus laevis]